MITTNQKTGFVRGAITSVIDLYAHARREWLKANVDVEDRSLIYNFLGNPSDSMQNWNDAEKRRIAMATSWIYSDIRLIAQEFSAGKFEVQQRDGEQVVPVTNHPFELLLRKPNEYIDLTFLWQYTIMWMQLRGNGYWFLAPETGNPDSIVEIWPIASDRLAPVPDPLKLIKAYAYRTNQGGLKPIDPRYIVHFRYPNPFSLIDGLPPLSAALLPMETEVGTGTFQKDTYVSGRGVPHSVIMLNEDMNDRDFAATSAMIREDFEKERKIIIARGNDLKVATVGLSQREMNLVGQRSFTRDELDTVFLGVALHKDGAGEGELRQLDKMFKEKTIHPLHELIAGQITVQALHRYYGEEFLATFEDIRTQDRALNVQERNVYWRVKKLNEARKDLGLPQYEDADIGELLVPLATDPAYVAMLMGLSRTGATPDTGKPDSQRRPAEAVGSLSQADAPVNVLTDTASGVKEAIRVEMGRWKKVALHNVKSGKNPGLYPFISDIIPRKQYLTVRGQLLESHTEESVKGVFDLVSREANLNLKADARGGGRGRRTKEIVAVNAYQTLLEDDYSEWADTFSDDLSQAENDESRKAVIIAALAILLLLLQNNGRKNIPEAMFLAIGKEPPTTEMLQMMVDRVAENDRYLAESLIPDLQAKIERALADADIQLAFQMGIEAGRDAIRAILQTVEVRIAMYAGAWWKVFQMATGMLSDVHQKAYRWNLDPLVKDHCQDCLDWGDRTYDSFAVMLQTTGGRGPGWGNKCGGNDRCSGEEIDSDS